MDQRTPKEDKLKEGGRSLKDGGYTPGPFIADEIRAKGRPSDDERASIPQTVIDRGHTSAMLGVADFREQHRGGNLSKRIPKTKEDTATYKGCWTIRELAMGTPDLYVFFTRHFLTITYRQSFGTRPGEFRRWS